MATVLLLDLSGVLLATIEVLMALPEIIPISKMLLLPAIIEDTQSEITVIGIQEVAMELLAMDLLIIEIQAIPEATLTTIPIILTETIATTIIVTTPILILQEIPVATTQIGQVVMVLSDQEALVEVIEAVAEAAVVAEAVDENLN